MVTQPVADGLARYADHILAASARARLVGREDPAWLLREQIVPSLLVQRVAPPDTASLLDLGAGAGIVGIACALARPEWRVVLLESVRRKYLFLYDVIRSLELPRTEAVWSRAEAQAGEPELAGGFDLVTARAVGPPSRVLPLAAPFLRERGRVVVFEGGAAPRAAVPGWRGVQRISSVHASVALEAWERGKAEQV